MVSEIDTAKCCEATYSRQTVGYIILNPKLKLEYLYLNRHLIQVYGIGSRLNKYWVECRFPSRECSWLSSQYAAIAFR